MAKYKKNSISVDGVSFHKGELAKYKTADELVSAMKGDKTYSHIFETEGGEQALRTAYDKAAPKAEVTEQTSDAAVTSTDAPTAIDADASTGNGKKKR